MKRMQTIVFIIMTYLLLSILATDVKTSSAGIGYPIGKSDASWH